MESRKPECKVNDRMKWRPCRPWVLGLVAVAAAIGGWVVFWDDSSEPRTAVLGGYRDRWFLMNVLISYAALVAVAVAALRPSHRTLFKVAALHLGALFAITLVELGAYCGLLDFSSVFQPNPYRTTTATPDARLRKAGLPHEHFSGNVYPDLVGILGADAQPMPVDYRSDRYGLRNPRDKDDPRVLFVGDSVLVAGLLRVEDTVTERVERSLVRPVLNVSESGYSPQEGLARLDTLDLDLAGRLVVQFIFEGNDLADSAAWRAWRAHAGGRSSDTGLVKAALTALHRPRTAAGRRRTGSFTNANGESTLVHFLYDDVSRRQWLGELPFLLESIEHAQDDIEARGGSYAVAFIPMKLTALRAVTAFDATGDLAHIKRDTTLRDALVQLCADREIPFIDLGNALQLAAGSGTLPYFAADTHLNAAGHAVMATALTPWLADLLDDKSP